MSRERVSQLTKEQKKNTYKGDGLFATQIGFNPTWGFLRVVASDGTRYMQK